MTPKSLLHAGADAWLMPARSHNIMPPPVHAQYRMSPGRASWLGCLTGGCLSAGLRLSAGQYWVAYCGGCLLSGVHCSCTLYMYTIVSGHTMAIATLDVCHRSDFIDRVACTRYI